MKDISGVLFTKQMFKLFFLKMNPKLRACWVFSHHITSRSKVIVKEQYLFHTTKPDADPEEYHKNVLLVSEYASMPAEGLRISDCSQHLLLLDEVGVHHSLKSKEI